MDVCIHVPAGAAEVSFLDLPAVAPLPEAAPKEPFDRELFLTGALSAAAIHENVLDPGVDFEPAGQQLFDALMKGRVLEAWNARRTQWMDAVDLWEQGGKAGPRPSFRTFLCIQDSALAAIPWELLNSNANLFSTEATPWVRIDRLALERKDRALYRVRVMVINGADPKPASGDNIQAEQECAIVKKILDRRQHEFEVEVVTAPKSITELEKAIRDYGPHILHFVGHAQMDANGKPELLLYNGKNYSEWKQTAIEAFLPNLDFLRLSYLNACRTGQGVVAQEAKDATRSLAGTFLSRSLAVIGMHSDIRGPAALGCAENFYEGLLDGDSPDQALSRARRALANQFQSREPYLPSMTVRTFPDRILVLRPQPVGLRTEDFGAAINEVTRLFVDHKDSRRRLHEAIFCDRADREKRGVLITGDDGTGKTWLIQWVLHAFALRGVRVHYLSNPKGSWLDVLRQIRDAGGTALTQGGCSPEQAERFNWILHHISNGTEPPPFPSGGEIVKDAGEALAEILKRQPVNSIDARLCGAMRQCLEAAAEEHGLVLAIDAWDLGWGDQKENLFPDSFRAIYDHLLTPLLQSRNSSVRVILSVTPAFWQTRLARFHEVPVPYFKTGEIPDLAEQLLRSLCVGELDQKTIDFVRREREAMTARALYSLVERIAKTPMKKSLPDWLLASTSADDALLRMQNHESAQVPEDLWKRLAVAGRFDETVYATIAPGPSPIPFEQLTAMATVQSETGGFFVLSPDFRRTTLGKWSREDPALKTLARDLARCHQDSGRSDSVMFFTAVSEPDTGLAQFKAAYSAADAAFDLSRCGAILDLLRPLYSFLDWRLQTFLNDREQYLNARTRFADDYYKTLVYVERDELKDPINHLLHPATSQRILNLYGRGGLGKTMLVQRFIAHQCIPETSGERIPVARVDLDFLNLPLLSSQPWLLLLEAAIQWRPQMLNAPFSTLIGNEERQLAEQLKRQPPEQTAADAASFAYSGYMSRQKIEDVFTMGLGPMPALLIIDTLEESILHYPDGLVSLLEVLIAMQEKCPGLRILLSGRYALLDKDRTPLPFTATFTEDVLKSKVAAACLEPFTKPQATEYLTRMRRLTDPEVVSAIVDRCGGNPFELSLFAELAQGRPLLTRKEVDECPDVKLAYLVERVIDRIPNDEPVSRAVRWVLRYAVVPRELTRDYLDKVLAPYVAAESSGEAPRDDTKLPGRYVDQDRWTKDPAIPQVLDKVWHALESYASGYGWISGKGDVLHLQPEVVQPMRELLQRNEQSYPLYNELHEVSSKYFESKAKVATEPEKFGYWLAQALYHHFQRDGLNAAAAWTEYKRVCRAAGPEATLALAQSLSKDYLDDDLKPLPHFLTGAIVEMSLIDEAKRTGAFARLAIWLRPLSAGPQPAFGTLNNPGPLLDAARALGNRDQAGVNALLIEDWFKHCSDGNEYVAARLVQANSIAWSEFSRRDELLKDALARARKGDVPWFPEYLLLGHAAANLTRYRYPEAIQLYDQACGLALARGASAEVVGDLLLRLGDIASPNGEWSLVVTHALRVRDRELGFPAYDEAIGWRMQRALLFSDIKEARDLARGGHPGAAWERIGDLAAAEFKFQEAEAAYSTATGEYERDRYRSSAVQVQLKLTKMLLEGMGNVQRADATLKRIGHPGEQVHWAERNRLRMRIEAFRASEYGSTSMLTESLGALEGFRLPPVYQASLCATYLSDWDGEGDAAASELLKCLGMLETDQARWAALLPLQERRNPPADRGLAGQFSKIVSAPSEDGPDAFVHWLGYLAGCRFFHHHTGLRTAAERVVAYAGHNPYRLIPVLRLAPFDVEVPVPSTFNDSPVWGYVYLEAAERAWGRGDSGEFRNCADVLSAMSPFSGLHRAVWSFDLVQAMAAHGEGKHSEAKKLLESAKSVASELGDLREVGVIEEVEENLYPLISIREVRVEREMEVLIEIRDGAVVVDGKRVETEFAQRLAKPDDLYANFLTGYTTRIDGLQLELRKMVEHVEINRPRQLRISPASLATLPWELAFSPQDRVSRSVANSFVIQIPEPRPEPPRVAVLQEEADAERYGKRGYGLLSLRAEQYYAEAGLKAETFSLQNQDWQFRMQGLEPNIIHICSGFYQSTQPRDAVLDLEAGEKSAPVGASSLASILERFGHLTRRPVVILDLSWDLSDGLRQVLLRNYFAACLWEASPMRAVIAAGGYEGRKAIPELQLLASAVARRARLVDIYWDLRNRTKPELPPALYTDHADAPIC